MTISTNTSRAPSQFPADGYIYSPYSLEMFDQLLFKQ